MVLALGFHFFTSLGFRVLKYPYGVEAHQSDPNQNSPDIGAVKVGKNVGIEFIPGWYF
jgi:hypothetical protein